MAVFNLSAQPSIAHQFLAELRDTGIQGDRARFRRNLERIGQLLAYEISKTLEYTPMPVQTPLATATIPLPSQRIVLATVLRAGLPFHQGFLQYFEQADNAFVGAYRHHQSEVTFDIRLDYASSPSLDGCVLIMIDPMLATGASFNRALDSLLRHGKPAAIHIAAVIASAPGVEAVQRHSPSAHLWLGAIDPELNAKSYIVPGLGDAGDLAYGSKL
jgi:uracil phosphoribosyltransferase